MRLPLILALALTPPQATSMSPEPAPPRPMHAYVKTEHLVNLCTAPEDDPEGLSEACFSYLSGSVDMFMVFNSITARPSVCLPEGLELGRVRDAFLRYASRNPQEAEFNAGVTVIGGLVTGFPCPAIVVQRAGR